MRTLGIRLPYLKPVAYQSSAFTLTTPLDALGDKTESITVGGETIQVSASQIKDGLANATYDTANVGAGVITGYAQTENDGLTRSPLSTMPAQITIFGTWKEGGVPTADTSVVRIRLAKVLCIYSLTKDYMLIPVLRPLFVASTTGTSTILIKGYTDGHVLEALVGAYWGFEKLRERGKYRCWFVWRSSGPTPAAQLRPLQSQKRYFDSIALAAKGAYSSTQVQTF